MNEENRPFSRSADAQGAKRTLMPISGSFTPRECLAYGVRSATC